MWHYGFWKGSSGRVLASAIYRMTSVKKPREKTIHFGELTKPAVKRSENCRPKSDAFS
jgi:hypothetical protein